MAALENNKMILIVVAVIAVVAIAAAAFLVTNNNSSSNDKVTYYGNGGTYDGKDSIQSTSTVVMSGNIFTKEGYSFTAWNTKQDGSGTSYNEGGKVELGTKLYAQWSKNVPKVTFPENKLSDYFSIFVSGTGMPEKNIDAGGKIEVTANFTMTLKAKNGFAFCALDYQSIFNVYNDTQFKASHLSFSISATMGTPVISADGKTTTIDVSGIDPEQPLIMMTYNFSDFNKIVYSGGGGKTQEGKPSYDETSQTTALNG